MSEALRAAILRHPLESFLEPTGELDEATIAELDEEPRRAPERRGW